MDKSNIVAIYCRLSAEDRDKQNREDDSRSIQNQKSMLISYASRQGWDIYQIYSDDDYQGSDRTRPAFNQLLKDAEAGKFGIVLCKTQSRFTRELELVEKILHHDFLLWGIRFVGYADNADTDNKGNKKARQINGLVNEWYLEDLSDSIKSVLTDHRKKGMHIGSFALYGYLKDPEQKGHLIVDPEAAAVVHEVFELYAAGMGRTRIARTLNERGIPNPSAYKKAKGMKFGGSGKSNSGMWQYYTISSMIENEMYIGNMIQGKYENKTYKSATSSPVPKEKWIRVEGTHEAIIEKELWDRVQEIRKNRTREMCTGQIGIFAGKTRCMYCGYMMRSRKFRELRYLSCQQQYIGARCKGSFIAQRFLIKAILDELNKIIELYFDEDSADSLLFIKNDFTDQKNNTIKELRSIHTDMESLKRAIRDLYMDKTKEVISESDFIFLKSGFDEELQQKKKREAFLTEQLSKMNESINELKSKKDILESYKNVTELDRTIVDTLIDYIEIGRDDHKKHKHSLPPIKIHWKF